MRRALASLSLPLALLLITNVVPSFAQKTAGEVVEVRVREGAPLELACALRVEQRAAWSREGGALPAELAPAAEEPRRGGGVTARLRAAAARVHLAGVYSCAPGAQRLRVVVEPANAAPGEPAPAPAAVEAVEAEEGELHYYDLLRNASMTCTINNPSKLDYVWKKNGTLLEEVPEMKGRYRLEAGGATLVFPPRMLYKDDAGNYSCALAGAGDAAAQTWRLRPRVYTKLPANTNVVEGRIRNAAARAARAGGCCFTVILQICVQILITASLFSL